MSQYDYKDIHIGSQFKGKELEFRNTNRLMFERPECDCQTRQFHSPSVPPSKWKEKLSTTLKI